MIYVGIDPGKQGGIVMLENGEPERLFRTPLVGDQYDTAKMISGLKGWVVGAHVVIEQCQAFPKIGAGTNFKVGYGFGLWLGMLAALEIPHTVVQAQRWHKAMCKGVPGKDTKARALVVARRLWPSETFVPPGCKVPHDGLVDAALIAEWGRRELLSA